MLPVGNLMLLFSPVNGSIGWALPQCCADASAGITRADILSTEEIVVTGGSI